MRKSILLFSIGAVAGSILMLSGCSKKEAAVPAAQSAAASSAEGPVALKVKWFVGKRYTEHVELAQGSETRMTAAAQPMKRQMNTAQDYAISVLKETGDGGRELELAFLNQKVDVTAGGRPPMTFDSRQDPAKDAGDPVAALFRKLAGTRVRCLADASGGVTQVENFADFQSITAKSPTAAKDFFDAMYGENNLKKMFPTVQTLPDHPVKAGDTWPVKLEEEVIPVGTLVLSLNYTVKGWEQHDYLNCLRLEYTGGISVKAGPAAPRVNVVIENGKISGTAWFDPELGLTVDSTADQSMTLKIGNEPRQIITQQSQTMTRKLAGLADLAK